MLIPRCVSCCFDNRPLMKDDEPSLPRAPPDRCTSGGARTLAKRVGEQVVFRCDLLAVEIVRLPILVERFLVALFQNIQDILASIASARCTDLPEIVGHHRLEVSAHSSELLAMENRLALDKLALNVEQGREVSRFGSMCYFDFAADVFDDDLMNSMRRSRSADQS